MSQQIDTSTEAAGRTADRVALHSPPLADLLFALAAERDAERAKVARLRDALDKAALAVASAHPGWQQPPQVQEWRALIASTAP